MTSLDLVVEDGGRRICLVGDLDCSTAAPMRRVVGEALLRHRWLVVDLSRLGFIDSTGLGVLVGAVKRARASDGDIAFRCVPPQMQRVLEITHLDRVFHIEGSAAP